MTEKHPEVPEPEGYEACPHCTIQIPAGAAECPFCRRPLSGADPPPKSRLRFFAERPLVTRLLERYGRWIKAAVPALLALLVLSLLVRHWTAGTLKVVENPILPVQVSRETEGDLVVLRGTVTNQGDDIPDFSLRSVGVVVTASYRDGRRERKTVFPKTRFRGEGALLRGERGTFEAGVPSKGLAEIVISAEIVDLGMGRRLIRPRGR